MKRALFQNVKLIPGGCGAVIDRKKFLSAIVAVSLDTVTGEPTATAFQLEITHSDTEDGDFQPLEDTMAGLDLPMETAQGKLTGSLRPIPIQPGETLNLDLDLLGCKRYLKLNPSFQFEGGASPSAAAVYAVALGDCSEMPV